MAEEQGEFLIYRVATDRNSGRHLEPFLVVTAATRDEAERNAAQLTGVRTWRCRRAAGIGWSAWCATWCARRWRSTG